MNKKEMRQLLDKWEHQYHENRRALTLMKEAFGPFSLDSCVGFAIDETFCRYTETLQTLFNDTDELLYWYMLENSMGENQLPIPCRSKKKNKQVKTLDDLITILAESV